MVNIFIFIFLTFTFDKNLQSYDTLYIILNLITFLQIYTSFINLQTFEIFEKTFLSLNSMLSNKNKIYITQKAHVPCKFKMHDDAVVNRTKYIRMFEKKNENIYKQK